MFWMIGFVIIIIDLIILFFTFKIQWGKDIEINFENNNNKNEKSQNIDINITDIKMNQMVDNNIKVTEEIKLTNDSKTSTDKINENPYKIDDKESKSIEVKENKSVKSNEIKLDFFCNGQSSKLYEIKVKKDENFGEVINKLKEKYPLLKEKNMKAFCYESKILSQIVTLEENGITKNVRIAIYN